MVIEMHAGDKVVYLWGKTPFRFNAIASWWLTGITFKSLSSICVPLLFMISGYLLLSSQDTIFTFLVKRITKIIIPLITWSIFYLWWDGAFKQYTSLIASIKFAIRGILTGPVYFHLWFLYVLLGLYLVTPIIRRFVQAASDLELFYFIGLWIFSTIIFNLLFQLRGITISLLTQPYVSGFLGYFVAGYYLGKIDFSIRQVWIATSIFILVTIMRTLWAYYLTVDGGKFDTNLFEYITWHVIIASFTGFIMLKSLAQYLEKWTLPNVKRIIAVVSGTTFGIYLVHPQILKLLETGVSGFHLSTDSTHPLFAIPLTVLVTFFLSFVLVYILQKIPVIRLTVP